MKPRLLIVDADPAFRLRLITVLQPVFETLVPGPGDDVVKLARSARPEVALMAAGGRHRVEALRVARVLKTDVRIVPALAFYSRPGEAPPPRPAVEAVLVDGYLPDAEAETLASFASALARGEHPFPVTWPTPAAGPVRRALTRLLGR